MTALDTHPADLRVTLGGRIRPALATAGGTVSGVPVEAAVLSASHQIRTAAGEVLETLSCDPADAGHGTAHDPRGRIEGRVETATGIWTVAFASTVQRVTAAALATLLADLPRGTLVHRFPGPTDAVTAITLAEFGWRTWHAYPEHGLVAISTTSAHHVPVALPAGAAR